MVLKMPSANVQLNYGAPLYDGIEGIKRDVIKLRPFTKINHA